MKTPHNILDLSAHLFWDVDLHAMDFEKSKEQIIYKVLEYGLINDWNIIQEVYGLETIKKISLELRSLDAVTLAFLCQLFQIEKTNFRCYKLKQSSPNSWNY
jgi:ribosomal protein S8